MTVDGTSFRDQYSLLCSQPSEADVLLPGGLQLGAPGAAWRLETTEENGVGQPESWERPVLTKETLTSAFWPFLDNLVQIYEQTAVDESRSLGLGL